jgi:inhibitor of cysteine peptidase
MLVLDERANGARIDLAMGAEAALQLPENPTTGFRWQVDADGAPALALSGDRYEAPPRGRPGAAGRHVWSFRAVARRTGVIRLSYRRRLGAVARTFSVAIDVR